MKNNARAVRAVAPHRQAALEAQARRPRGGVAGVQPRRRLRRRARAHAQVQGRARRRAVGEERPHAWSRKLPSRAESSPLIDRGRLFFGTEDGTVYSLRARDGTVRWTYKAKGAVKGALALDDGKLYFGDYGGKVQAIRRSDGSKVWRVTPSSARSASAAATSTRRPAVSYGRVYIGSTNGNVYSFARADGKLAWRKRTGGYVYASPPSARPRRASDCLPRLLRRALLRARRAQRPAALGALAGRQDLRRGDDRRRPRVRLRPRKRTTWALGATRGATRLEDAARRLQPGDQRRAADLLRGFTSLFALDHVGRPFDRGRQAAAARARRTGAPRARAAAPTRSARRPPGAPLARVPRARRRARAPRERRAVALAPHGQHHRPRKRSPPGRHATATSTGCAANDRARGNHAIRTCAGGQPARAAARQRRANAYG